MQLQRRATADCQASTGHPALLALAALPPGHENVQPLCFTVLESQCAPTWHLQHRLVDDYLTVTSHMQGSHGRRCFEMCKSVPLMSCHLPCLLQVSLMLLGTCEAASSSTAQAAQGTGSTWASSKQLLCVCHSHCPGHSRMCCQLLKHCLPVCFTHLLAVLQEGKVSILGENNSSSNNRASSAAQRPASCYPCHVLKILFPEALLCCSCWASCCS